MDQRSTPPPTSRPEPAFRVLSFASRGLVRIVSSLPDNARSTRSFREAPTYRLRPAPRRMKMLKQPTPIRVLLALAALAALALVGSGCGTSTADEQRGRILFVQKCGT